MNEKEVLGKQNGEDVSKLIVMLAHKSLAIRTNQNSRTALHWAHSVGHIETVEFLLKLGVTMSARDDATLKNRYETAVLEPYGRAHPDAEDHHKATAITTQQPKDTNSAE
uniref:Uncharacterized protein n=1 Tax=Castor canadensis TaxID=51338 RepID=A0A8C0X047_CASCN